MLKRLLFAAALISGSPCLADYAPTKWGMSPDEVAKASRGALPVASEHRMKKDGLQVGNVGQRVIADVRFDVVAFYRGDRLVDVSLLGEATPAQCGNLIRLYEGRHGSSQSSEESQLVREHRWRAETDNNRISLMCFGNKSLQVVTIMYTPLRSADNEGL